MLFCYLLFTKNGKQDYHCVFKGNCCGKEVAFSKYFVIKFLYFVSWYSHSTAFFYPSSSKMPQGRAENILEDEDIGMIFIKRRYKFTQGKILMKVGQNYTESMQSFCNG